MARALGELERAKNIVNASPYTLGKNDAIQQAIAASPSVVPGTDVLVEAVPNSDNLWYRLRAEGMDGGITKSAQIFVRETSPVSAYNFFVVDHPLGISGAPRGAIHSNKTVDFYFPYGLYRDQVTAGEGFNFKAGATPQNTRLQGMWDQNAPVTDILAGVSMVDLANSAGTLRVDDNLLAEIEFQGKDTVVDLYTPSYTIQVEMTGTRSVFDHFDSVPYEVEVPVYNTVYEDVQVPVYIKESYQETYNHDVYVWVDVTKTKTENVYEDRTETYTEQIPVWGTRTVTVETQEQVWVEDPPPTLEEIEGGYAVGGKEPEFGHWETVTKYETKEEPYIESYREEERQRVVSVKIGEKTVTYVDTERQFSHTEQRTRTRTRNVLSHYETETQERQVFSHNVKETRYYDEPVYRDETYTYMEDVVVPETHARTETVPTDGIIYIEKDIRSLKGKVDGQVSVITNSEAKITDSIVYVDAEGDTRMLNGTDTDQKYQFNPDYQGKSVLGLMSNGDIEYSVDAPDKIEINASMLSLNGKVSMEGIEISADGEQVSLQAESGRSAADYIKGSIRRLGGIISRHRPVTTYVDESNTVLAGFQLGMSIMDRNMILGNGGWAQPPGVPQADRPTWSVSSAGRVFSAK